MIELTNKYNYDKPYSFENFIVHSEDGVYVESHSSVDSANSAITILNDHNTKQCLSQRFIYSKKEDIIIK